MLKNYFKIAIRNLLRNKLFSVINIFGLALSIAACLLIVLFVVDELSFDKHFSKANQIYRVTTVGKLNQQPVEIPLSGAPVGAQMKKDFPEVLEATRMGHVGGSLTLKYSDKTFKEEKYTFVDADFFKVFDFPFIKGNSQVALPEANTMVISDEAAKKYFGDAEPVGKVLQVKGMEKPYKITGVISKMPANTHFHYDLLLSMGVREANSTEWLVSNFYTYLLLKEETDFRKLEAKLPGMLQRHAESELKKYFGMGFADFFKAGNDLKYLLQPLTAIHLNSHLEVEHEGNGNRAHVYIFSAIAVFILLIACINFMNLSTAGATKRAKEVGIRKVLGSDKKKLVGQFLWESVFLTFLALALAMVMISVVLPVFNELSGKTLSLYFLFSPALLAGLLFFGVLAGILAGSYPAFYLSSFQPIAVIKSGGLAGKLFSGTWLPDFRVRSVLVVFQFSIAIVLLVGTVVGYQQLIYMQHKELGYNKEQVLILHETYNLGSINNEALFKEKLKQNPQVLGVSISHDMPLQKGGASVIMPKDNRKASVVMREYGVDYDYLATMRMRLIQGRFFSEKFATDSSAALLNEAAVLALGWEKDPIGRKFFDNRNNELHVIGVLKDFHYEKVDQKIGPLFMRLGNNYGAMAVKIKTDDIAGLLASVKETWNNFTPEAALSYSFLDERFAEAYRTDQRLSKIVAIFAGLAIIVACLGLFGLVTFTAHQRTKEIGVRKVLGASISSIMLLLSKDFLKLVLVANIIAWPLAWWGMHQWLQDFAYRMDINWWIFALAGLAAVVIALLTVSFQALKAALANPVNALRNE
jgi:putative ABC transport system permease protein